MSRDRYIEFETLNDIAQEVHDLAVEKGWWPEKGRPESEILMNIHQEVSEIWDAYRNGKLKENCDKPIDLTCYEEELADIIIRVLDTAISEGIDIGRAVCLKHEYNKTRPFRHGNKKA